LYPSEVKRLGRDGLLIGQKLGYLPREVLRLDQCRHSLEIPGDSEDLGDTSVQRDAEFSVDQILALFEGESAFVWMALIVDRALVRHRSLGLNAIIDLSLFLAAWPQPGPWGDALRVQFRPRQFRRKVREILRAQTIELGIRKLSR
jgi:hypothetical protein